MFQWIGQKVVLICYLKHNYVQSRFGVQHESL